MSPSALPDPALDASGLSEAYDGEAPPQGMTLFVTGASGYVGGRLVPALIAAGHSVRCLAREPRKLANRPWRTSPLGQVLQGDMTDVAELTQHMQGCSTAYYLVHSMEASGDRYAARDRQLAATFAEAAAAAGLKRIIYLGGLGEMGEGLSSHLRSRREVEELLASTGVPVTTFRAAMIIGAGSASFEILRHLVERLPVMVTPSWVKTESQPVGITDVLYWLTRCLAVPETTGKTLEIGGADVLPYSELMRIMAEELGLPRRVIVPLPFLTPRLSSLWISLVTPVSYRVARPLAEGLRNRVVVTGNDVQRLMPHQALGVREAIHRALRKVEANAVETRWSAAGPIPGDPHWAGGTVYTDQRSVLIDAPPEPVFNAVCRIGGGNGWYAGDLLWRIRGWMDNLVGGPGLRRGRRHSEHVEFGEALDFWRVVGIERNRSLSLLAEMKLPGEAMLNFELEPSQRGDQTKLTMTARYRPKGLFGILYWYAVVPLHNIVFGGMLRGIRRTAETTHRAACKTSPEVSPTSVAVPGYGRARLWLGISAVGTIVMLATAGLALGLTDIVASSASDTRQGQILTLLGFVLAYGIIHLPFDLLGGYVLPRRYGRLHPSLPGYLAGLARGAITHGAMLFLAAVLLMVAGQFGGIMATVVAGFLIALMLLQGRVVLASLLAPLDVTPSQPASGSAGDGLPVFMATSPDEGFTGGILGVLHPRCHLLPGTWRTVLGAEGFNIAMERRSLAVETGSWRRGRIVAVVFTVVGLAVASWLVGPARLGTAGGTIDVSLWFTLWSFLGLLTLPTLSRYGVLEVDDRCRAEGCSEDSLCQTTRLLDNLQDGERDRPGVVETIFHPIPSVRHRLEGPRSHGVVGGWDAARTTVFLSLSGLGLLGRAVHCNCGRPSLWVFLPTD